jgi:5,10-methenyltetrahydromethanopterin hydrogenase
MALVVESPNEAYTINNETDHKKVFLAGGITDCPDWQADFIKLMEDVDNVTLYNPRRASFDVKDPDATEVQIVWEHRHLDEADIIIYWFSRGSLNPIVLYELGKYINTDKKILIGMDPEYTRKTDVEVQSKLVGYKDNFYNNIEDLKDALMNIIT